MAEYLVIDGYNIINAWTVLIEAAKESLESARLRLIDIMQDYQGFKGCKTIIVFDAHLSKDSVEKHEFYGEVEVVYTRYSETADHFIERWVDRMGRKHPIRVATSDLVEQTIIFSKGAIRVSARELQNEIRAVKEEQNREYLEKPKPKENLLSDRVHPSVLEKLERWRRER